MPHDPIGCDPRHERIAIMHALSPAELEGERDGVGEVCGIGRGELFIVGHRWTIAQGRERSKNESPAREEASRGANERPWAADFGRAPV